MTPLFTGKERDGETGLDYFGARYFSGGIGRFTSPDLPFMDQRSADPQSWNLFVYGRNNPLKYIDPTGHCSTPALAEGQLGICVDLYISRSTLPTLIPMGVAFGDGRGPAPNDPKATSRVELQFVVDLANMDVSKVKDEPGLSIATVFERPPA